MYDDFPNWTFLEFWKFLKLSNFENLIIFEIEVFQKFDYFSNGQ